MSLQNSRRFPVLGIIILTFLIRFILVLLLPQDKVIFPDSNDYLKISENIISGKGIILEENSKAKRPPAYSLYLALHKAIFGDCLFAVQLTQIILSTLLVFLIYRIGFICFNPTVAFISSIIFAIHPYLVFLTSFILEDTLFVFLLGLEIYLLVSGVRNRKLWLILIAGIVSGTASLTQAGHLLSFIFIAIAILLVQRNRFSLSLLGFVLMHLITVLPWVIRNYIVLDAIVPVTTHLGATLYESFGPGATGGPCVDKIVWPEEIKTLGEVERDRLLRKKTLEVIKKEPLRALDLSRKKLARFFNIIPNEPSFITTINCIASITIILPLFVLGGYGLFMMFCNKEGILWLFLAPISYYTLLHSIFVGSIFYRIPVEPYIILFASYGIYSLLIGNGIHKIC